MKSFVPRQDLQSNLKRIELTNVETKTSLKLLRVTISATPDVLCVKMKYDECHLRFLKDLQIRVSSFTALPRGLTPSVSRFSLLLVVSSVVYIIHFNNSTFRQCRFS